MTRSNGYSLWLIPSNDVYRRLTETISQLSRKYSTPKFEPHITLIGEVDDIEEELVSKTGQLASISNPFTVKLTYVDYLDQYFRCIFLRVEETDDLMMANNKARETFGRQQDPKFMPHLSLMYGNFSSELKQQVIVEIGRNFNLSFDINSVHLFSTDGEPKDWYRVREFSFK